MTPEQARIRSHESWARTPDRAARTAAARKGLDARFEREARERLGDNASDRAIAQAAASAKRAYQLRLAQAGLAARRAAAASP